MEEQEEKSTNEIEDFNDEIFPGSTKKKTSKLVEDFKRDMNNPTVAREQLDIIFKSLDEDSKDFYKKNNLFINNIELYNNRDLNDDKYKYLYPSLDDNNFNIKISQRKEFYDYKNNQQIVDNIEEYADKICNARFELAPHQILVKNFLSFYTPYNSILLYHGLGTGKTCSAIGIAEETRKYLKQFNMNKKIIIIATPNVQDNFRLQLFDERKLELLNGSWNIENCVGNTFIDELNISSFKELSKVNIVKQINNIINLYYDFYGYTEFANDIIKTSEVKNQTFSDSKIKKQSIKQLRDKYSDSLIIIDEVQNIRSSEDEKKDKNKLITQQLYYLVENVENIKLVLLSATPLYNSYQEIIWLINFLNKNDKRSQIELSDVFDSNGDFIIDESGEEVGKNLLARKARGYISFVKGDNPYTFPYRIFPNDFDKSKSVKNIDYPKLQLNSKSIIEPLKHTDIYINNIGEYQIKGYDYILSYIKNKQIDIYDEKTSQKLDKFKNLDKFGYTLLQKPIEALNIIYPIENIDNVIQDGNFTIEPSELIGKTGLNRLMGFTQTNTPNIRNEYYFKTNNYGNIFLFDNIGKYSGKIKTILDNIINSEGIIMVYSQYIDGGILPLALALESMGITRYGETSNLFKTPPKENIDYKTYKTKDEMETKNDFSPAKYIMITGDKSISPNNLQELKFATDLNNVDGSRIKVILISQAAAEGLDFKYIRQLHILDPWYNMNRIEQIIGRGVRQCSHKNLPLQKRNVQIFLHGTMLKSESENENESVDLYIYRLAEQKATQIGKITRILKQVSIDCILNSNQQNFRENILNKKINITLSNKNNIDYMIGDKPYTAACDYMDDCYYKCIPHMDINTIKPDMTTYGHRHIELNSEKIIQYIKELYRDRYFYYYNDIINFINVQREYPQEQIDFALKELILNANQFITDKYDRIGRLVKIDDLYIYQPIELDQTNESIYNRSMPIEYKNKHIKYSVNEKFKSIGKNETLPQKDSKNIDKDSKKNSKKEFNGVEDFLEKNQTSVKPILTNIQEKYNKVIEQQILLRGEADFYKSLSIIVQFLIDKKDFDRDSLYNLSINHILETLEFNEVLILLNYLYNKESSLYNEIEYKIFNYFNNKIIQTNITGMLLQEKNDYIFIVRDKNGIWKLAESEDLKDLEEKIQELKISLNKYNKIVGFIGTFKGEFNIFKVKQLDKKRNKGARCDQTGKTEAINILNDILGEEIYTFENTKKFNQNLICILQEIYLRYFDLINKNNLRWFLYPGEALINNIEKLYIE